MSVVSNASPLSQPQIADAPRPWSLLHRIAFRFTCVYFTLYNLPFPLSDFTGTSSAAEAYHLIWRQAPAWVAKQLFGVEITVFTNGSGDTTYNYFEIACYAAIAAIATLIWSFIDGRRARYDTLHDWLRRYLRYSLACAMLGYGSIKVIQLQFPIPTPDRLMQTYGDSSPMGLLWTFMGASTAYTFFAGFSEVVGGLLLIPRRTTTLGALVTAGVMSNVVMLNFCYDVPVKLYSSHLLAMAIFLTLPDLPRLAKIFLLNRPAPAAYIRPLSRWRWLNVVGSGAKTLATVYVVYHLGSSALRDANEYGDNAPRPLLYGVYQVEEFVRNDTVLPDSLSESTRWRTLAIGRYGTASARRMDDARDRFLVEVNEQAGNIIFKDRMEQNKKVGDMTFVRPDDRTLELKGTLKEDSLVVRLKKLDAPPFLLTSRGFHWINEYPFNR